MLLYTLAYLAYILQGSFTAGQIDSKNAQLRSDLIAAIPSWLLSNIAVSRRLDMAFFSFVFLNNGISSIVRQFEGKK